MGVFLAAWLWSSSCGSSRKPRRILGPQPFRLEDVQPDDPLFHSDLKALEAGENVVVTGRAGTGKSTLLRYFRETTLARKIWLGDTIQDFGLLAFRKAFRA